MRQTEIIAWAHCRLVMIVLPAVAVAACAGLHESPDYERHRYSRLSEPFERNDVLYFDVTFDPNFPDNNPVAEAKRMEWLTGWLAKRKMCLDGFKILKRRPFDTFENNPARHDIRYEVQCKIPAET